MKLSRYAVAAAWLPLAFAANAATITQWNFNSTTADGNTGTGVTTPAIGAGSAALVGGATATFASGDSGTGSSDPATGDDSGWNLTTFAAQGTGDKTRGAQFNISTVGFDSIVLTYDLRHSNTSSRYEQVQYTLDGSNFIDLVRFDGNLGDTWFNGRIVNLGSIAGASNNALFGVRVVETFAPGTSAYAPSNASSSYGTTSTWRFDMVTVSGQVMASVPEPGALVLSLAGLAALGLKRRRG